MTRVQEVEAVVRVGAEGERYAIAGHQIVFKSPTEAAPGTWTAVDFTVPARTAGPPLHYHADWTESFYVLSGQLWIKVADREILAGPGSYVLAPPGTLHTFANRSGSPARFLGHSSGPELKAFLREIFEVAEAEGAWPPRDAAKLVEIGRRYGTYYVAG